MPLSSFSQIIEDLEQLRMQAATEERWESMENYIDDIYDRIHTVYQTAQDKDTDAWDDILRVLNDLEQGIREKDEDVERYITTLLGKIRGYLDTTPYASG